MTAIFSTVSVFIETGLVFSLVAIGYYVSYAILDFPDLTVEGTFLLGAVVFGTLSTRGVNPFLALLLAMLAGALFGALTGVLHVKLGIRPLLSGILTSTALISINLVLTSAGVTGDFSGEGSSIISYGASSALHTAPPFVYLPARVLGVPLRDIVIYLAVVLIIKYLLDLFLKTKCGLLLRATGDNARYVTSLGCDAGGVKILGLAIGNATAALGGALYSNLAGNVNQGMGIGTVVIGLASLIIGTSVFAGVKFLAPTTKVIFGAILYQACLTLAQRAGIPGAYNKLIMAVLFTAALVFASYKKSRGRVAKTKKFGKEGEVRENA